MTRVRVPRAHISYLNTGTHIHTYIYVHVNMHAPCNLMGWRNSLSVMERLKAIETLVVCASSSH